VHDQARVDSPGETREQMEAVGAGRPTGVQDQALPATGLTQPHLETYEVTMHG